MSEHPPSISVTLPSVNLTLDEFVTVDKHKRKWAKAHGMKVNEESMEQYLRAALMAFTQTNTA